jgi:hypothetical protein
LSARTHARVAPREVLPKTCPRVSAYHKRRRQFILFPGTFGCPGRGNLVEAIRAKVVLYAFKSDNKNRRFAAV